MSTAEHSEVRVGSASPRRGGWLVLMTVAVALVYCSSAQALTSAGHAFVGTFGSPGVGDGQFAKPADVAVDEANGLAYVSDAGNGRVQVFKRAADGDYSYVSQFKLRYPGPIAVDNSTSSSDPSPGEVYVAGAANKEEEEEGLRNVLFVYSPAEGGAIHKIRSFKFKEKGGEGLEEEEEFEENISGVDVDAGGTLWVYWEEEGIIDAFEKQLTAGGKSKLQWIPSLRRSMEERFECYARAAFAVAADAKSFYVGYERPNIREECPGEGGEAAPDATVVAKLDGQAPVPATLIAEVDHHDTTGAAVDGSDEDVYLDNISSVAAYAPDGTLIQRFGSDELVAGSGVAVDATHGEVLVPDSSEDRVAVFGLEGTPHQPTIDRLSSQNLTPQSSQLHAQIDPGGLASEYHFQYGTSDCAQNPAACVNLPSATIAAGYGDVSVSAPLEGLSPATAYYYRVIVSNALAPNGVSAAGTFTTLPSPGALPDARGWEMVSPPQKHGSTIEMPAQLRGGSIQASPDGSRLAWVSAGPVISEPQGNRSFELSQLMSVREADAWSTTSLETPHTNGWGLLLPSPGEYHFFSEDLTSSLLAPTEYEQGKTEGIVEHPALSPLATEKTLYLREDLPSSPGEFLPLVTAANDTAATKFGGGLDFVGATSDLTHVGFHSKVGLNASAPSAAGLYLWQQGAPLALVSVLPDGTPAPDSENIEPSLGAAQGLNVRNAISNDARRVFWTEGEGRALYMRDTVANKTIKLNAAQGHQATEAGPGGQEVPEPSEPEPEREARQVHFQGASADGSTVFFTDTAPLTEDSTQAPSGEESPTDLYEFQLTGEGPLRGRLRDLSAGAPGASGDVLNLIPGSSKDGSVLYFVANAVLAPGATPGQCSRNPEFGEPSPPGATCNLYVSEADPAHPGQRHTRFIATLSSKDAADWGAGETSHLGPQSLNLSSVTSRVSPNGRYLTFMSQQSLTGYDNRDAVSGELDEEVFLYDAAAGRLLCVSCNAATDGGGWTRPHGVFDTELAGEGLGLLADRGEIWQQRWLAGSLPSWGFNFNGSSQPAALYQPRYLSDSGRMFFNSADGLISQDQNAKEDVYQYEPAGVGSCTDSGGCTGLISSGTSDRESAFLDASENGNDVFFLTATPLVAADTDQSIDIYDAHVCSDGSPCLQYPTASSTPCESAAACRPSSTSSQSAPAPATTTFSGPGNPPPGAQQVRDNKMAKAPAPLTRAQKLTRALKQCRKRDKHSKPKRARCERQAHKKYGRHKHKAAKHKEQKRR